MKDSLLFLLLMFVCATAEWAWSGELLQGLVDALQRDVSCPMLFLLHWLAASGDVGGRVGVATCITSLVEVGVANAVSFSGLLLRHCADGIITSTTIHVMDAGVWQEDHQPVQLTTRLGCWRAEVALLDLVVLVSCALAHTVFNEVV